MRILCKVQPYLFNLLILVLILLLSSYGMFLDEDEDGITNDGLILFNLLWAWAKILGNITCKPGGTFIGPRNVTIVVSGKHGSVEISFSFNDITVGLIDQENRFSTRTQEPRLSIQMEICLSITLFLRSPPYIPIRWDHDVVRFPLTCSTLPKLFSLGVIMIFESKRYAQGGVEGGTHIKIKGNSFDGYNDATKVMLR